MYELDLGAPRVLNSSIIVTGPETSVPNTNVDYGYLVDYQIQYDANYAGSTPNWQVAASVTDADTRAQAWFRDPDLRLVYQNPYSFQYPITARRWRLYVRDADPDAGVYQWSLYGCADLALTSPTSTITTTVTVTATPTGTPTITPTADPRANYTWFHTTISDFAF